MENKSEGVSQVLVHKIEEMSISNTDMSTEDGEDAKEKTRLICQVLELQNTLDDLSVRVDKVKEENLKLKSENQVLGQYIENLMSASSVFQSTSPKNKKKRISKKSLTPDQQNWQGWWWQN
ncbi:short coiled-coil protein B-like isoform X1 [Apostichopus japonicus]|uniref:short coiled-coil protein B-like isoform X1 n=1 Tax=Stichopus japonicus TaxID=307972 RepID=UPI003AB8F5FA